MDWREGRSFIPKRNTTTNILIPITNDFSDWYFLNEIPAIPRVSKCPIHKSSTSDGMELSSDRSFATKLVEDGVFSLKEMYCSKPRASNGDERGKWILEDWMELTYTKLSLSKLILSASNWEISVLTNSQVLTLDNHKTNVYEVTSTSMEVSQWRKI